MVSENELVVVTPREDAMDAFQKLAQKEMHQMPVVQNGTWIGVLPEGISCTGRNCALRR